jgi:glycosyltransferase involved in cell wall biosynthesis
VDTDHFHPRRRTSLWRSRLSGGHPEAPLLLFVSRLSQEKRAQWLLPVLEALPKARLAIVGDGPDRPRLERLFRGTPTVFTGFLRGDALAHAYAAGDLFVFPAANETLGNVVLEAMASGLPVVAVDSGGPRELIEHGRNGLLCPPERVEPFVEAVKELVNRPVLTRTLGAAARRYATGRSWQTVFDGLLDDYRRLARNARVPETGRAQFNQWPGTR